MTTLEPGMYAIPSEYTIVKMTPHMFVVREKKRTDKPIGKRCQDCVHYVRGKAMLHEWHDNYVCDLKKKRNGLHYVARPLERACDKFEER